MGWPLLSTKKISYILSCFGVLLSNYLLKSNTTRKRLKFLSKDHTVGLKRCHSSTSPTITVPYQIAMGMFCRTEILWDINRFRIMLFWEILYCITIHFDFIGGRFCIKYISNLTGKSLFMKYLRNYESMKHTRKHIFPHTQILDLLAEKSELTDTSVVYLAFVFVVVLKQLAV